MQTMQISLPDPQKEFVDHRVANGRYADVNDYISGLIHEDERRAAQEQLESLLMEGMQGDPVELDGEEWLRIRAEAMALLDSRSSGKV